MKFSSALIDWYHLHKRDLPWRNTTDPYVIWLSEIIMQQTRVGQGLPYFYRFLKAFPRIEDFARAEEGALLKLWQGLGYYSRARNMHHAARQVMNEHEGKFPADHGKLLQLKGVGDYTAAAIASFAFNLPHPVVDGNVSRLLTRYLGIYTPVNSPAGKKEITAAALLLIDKQDPGTFNQAVMEFGSLVCKPQNPLCGECIFIHSCYAYANRETGMLPVKVKTCKPRTRFFNYLFIRHSGNFYIRQRKERDIWQHLYELPLIETTSEAGPGSIAHDPGFTYIAGDGARVDRKVFRTRHQLTHQTIEASFYTVNVKKSLPQNNEKHFLKVSEKALETFPFPKLIENYLNSVFHAKS